MNLGAVSCQRQGGGSPLYAVTPFCVGTRLGASADVPQARPYTVMTSTHPSLY